MMKGILTKDPTNPKFWLVVTVTTGRVFGVRLEKGCYAPLQKLEGDIAVTVDGDGNVAVGDRVIGSLVGWNGQPTSAEEAAWTLVTESGRAGRLGRALKRAVKDGRLTAEEAAAWVRRYLGPKAEEELETLLEDNSSTSSEEELLEVLKQHLLNHDEEGDLPPW